MIKHAEGKDGFKSRGKVDWNVSSFFPVNENTVFVLGSFNLWREHGPFGVQVPPRRELVSGNVTDYSVLTENELFIVKGGRDLIFKSGDLTDHGELVFESTERRTEIRNIQAVSRDLVFAIYKGDLWSFEKNGGNWERTRVEQDVFQYQALDSDTIFVRDAGGILWREEGPFGHQYPARRVKVDVTVADFHALNANTVFIRGSDLKLWCWSGNGGSVQVDYNVSEFQPLDINTVLVKGTDLKLWREHGPFGEAVPPTRTEVDWNVADFHGVSSRTVFVKGTDMILWCEHL
ncbi:hypothetical protein [Zoogloea sp.]|uniref:hypothetical protein n=1 Tax=Zoogloea sp. TaxID=49181 RepID=UPI0035B2D8AE